MGPGLQLLAFSTGLDLASQIGSTARGAVENFAALVSPESEVGEASVAAQGNESSSDRLDRIQAGLADRLQRLGLPPETPLQIEVQSNGALRVDVESGDRLAIEDAILSDETLVAEIRKYAQDRAVSGESYFIHSPASEFSALPRN